MNVVVLTKWVPEPEGTPTLGDDGLLVREGADGALDPGDEYGLEAALQLVEAAGDGEITLLTMGPEVAHAALQRGLAMGAHKGVRITDDSLRGADSLVTARVLAAAIKRQPFDLVVGGVESTDGYTGIVPAAIAELLGVPSLTFARELAPLGRHAHDRAPDGGRLRRRRRHPSGRHHGDGRRDRAPLSLAEGRDGREVEAGRDA